MFDSMCIVSVEDIYVKRYVVIALHQIREKLLAHRGFLDPADEFLFIVVNDDCWYVAYFVERTFGESVDCFHVVIQDLRIETSFLLEVFHLFVGILAHGTGGFPENKHFFHPTSSPQP